MSAATVAIGTGPARREVILTDYLDAAAEESATTEAHAWIKSLRHANVDGQPLRRRFTYRGDSLWWFAELYLHKQQVVLEIFRTIRALEQLIAIEHPDGLSVSSESRIACGLVPRVAALASIPCTGPRDFPRTSPMRIVGMDARGAWLHLSAVAARMAKRSAEITRKPSVAAFIHRAFWRTGTEDGSAESYIGPVLTALERRLPAGAVQYVSLGPSENFRARHWWSPLTARQPSQAAIPVEDFAPLARLKESRAVWRRRHAFRRALWRSADLRKASVIHGCDCWPIVREELAGIALLQWPWSARVMDEAAAALDSLKPGIAVTYAEAGGWGRALILECRRRNIPTAGLQHGFIYRQWLNYLHEPDEMAPDPQNPGDRGFPRPSVTLTFDDYAATHLVNAGRFPRESVRISGSPRLDDLVAAASRLTEVDLASARSSAGVTDADALVLLVTKHREAQRVLPALVAAAGEVPGVHLAIKAHPAETPSVYDHVARGHGHVTILPASTPLAPLLRASRAIVTVNSTVALDAAVLGIPALVIGLSNNLTPFVDAGLLAGAALPDLVRRLRQILYDEEFRQGLWATRRDLLARFGMGSDGRAADRTVDAVLELLEPRAPEPTRAALPLESY
jgi:hypothetical protein